MKYGFQSGLNQLTVGVFPQVKKELMAALNITSRSSWAARTKGRVEPKASEVIIIEKILAKYGVTKNIWG